MNKDSVLDIILRLSQALTGIASVAIAVFLARLGNKQRKDAWFKAFNELHHSFWSDGACVRVRAWIANDVSYAELDAVLKKRLAGRDKLTADEYSLLESLDKFFNFLLRAREVATELETHQDLWKRIYFQYWFDDIITAKRHRLWVYYLRFYQVNAPILQPSLPTSKVKEFEAELPTVINEV